MAFQTKRFLRNKIMHLEYRVKDLEERLCPCESHDWRCVKHHVRYEDYGYWTTIKTLKCKRCGKMIDEEELDA